MKLDNMWFILPNVCDTGTLFTCKAHMRKEIFSRLENFIIFPSFTVKSVFF